MTSLTEQLPRLEHEDENSSNNGYNEKNGNELVVVVGKAQTEGLVKVEAAQRVW